MYRTLSWDEFVAAMVVAHLERSSGTLFFFSENQDWGKVVFREGEITALGYKLLHGRDALALLRSVPTFQVRMQGLLLELLESIDNVDLNELIQPGLSEQLRHSFNYSTTEHYFIDMDIDYARMRLLSRQPHTKTRRTMHSAAPLQHAPRLHVPDIEVGGHEVAAGAGSSMTVLVVEDSNMTRRLIARALLSAGYRVLEAPDGFKALAILGNEAVDLLVVDLIMPGIDGYKVINSVKQRASTREMPIIILTSRDSLMDRLKGRLSPSDEYLTKPFDPNLLVDRVNYYLRA